jgi:N-acetylneuraminic acid mutarotase
VIFKKNLDSLSRRNKMINKKVALLLSVIFLLSSSSMVTIEPCFGNGLSADQWVSNTPMHEARSGLGVEAVNGKIYAIGGSAENGFIPNAYGSIIYTESANGVATNEEFNPETNTWIYKAPMPTARLAFATAVYKDKIYCIGGQANGSFIGQNEVYDPVTNSWEIKTSMPTARGWVTASVVNGKIYVMSGYSPKPSTVNEVYDPETNSWENSTPSPSNPIDSCTSTSTVVDNRIYLIGGVFGYSNLNQIYDAQTDSWSSGRSPPSSISGGAAASTSGAFAPKRIYLIGDALTLWQGAPQYSNRVYDPKMASWAIAKDIPSERFHFGIAVVNDTLYVIGGNTYTIPGYYAPVALNEQYIPIGYGTADPSYVSPTEINPPKINVTSPINLTYNQSSVPIVFKADKAVNWTSYSLDGQQNVTFSGNTNLTDISNGVHNITIYAQDTFGNIGSSQTTSFTIAKPEAESFPVVPVAVVSVVAVALVAAGLLVYHKKHRHSLNAV